MAQSCTTTERVVVSDAALLLRPAYSALRRVLCARRAAAACAKALQAAKADKEASISAAVAEEKMVTIATANELESCQAKLIANSKRSAAMLDTMQALQKKLEKKEELEKKRAEERRRY